MATITITFPDGVQPTPELLADTFATQDQAIEHGLEWVKRYYPPTDTNT
jgi:hypothetical protein